MRLIVPFGITKRYSFQAIFSYYSICRVPCCARIPIFTGNFRLEVEAVASFDDLICHQKSELCANKEIEETVIKNDVLLTTVICPHLWAHCSNGLIKIPFANSLFVAFGEILYASTMNATKLSIISIVSWAFHRIASELHHNDNNVHSLEFQFIIHNDRWAGALSIERLKWYENVYWLQ